MRPYSYFLVRNCAFTPVPTVENVLNASIFFEYDVQWVLVTCKCTGIPHIGEMGEIGVVPVGTCKWSPLLKNWCFWLVFIHGNGSESKFRAITVQFACFAAYAIRREPAKYTIFVYSEISCVNVDFRSNWH